MPRFDLLAFPVWSRAAGVCLVACLGLSFLGCKPSSSTPATAPAEEGPPWFADITSEVGLDFVHDCGPVGTYFMPQMTAGGAALFDFDNDGRLDIYLLQNAGPDSRSTNRLYRQKADGRFEDVSARSGLAVAGYGQGVAVGDVNNDNRVDVLITEYGRVRLFLNNGDGTFTDVTKEAGLDNPHWGTSAAFCDYDRDGWLDLVIVNYVLYNPTLLCLPRKGGKDYCGPSDFPGTASKIFRNRGAAGGPGGAATAVRFEDATVRSGLARVTGPGLGVVCADFDGDGWPDIFIANDGKPNHLWMNQHDGTFKEEAVPRGAALNAMGNAEANMGIALGDVDGDGLFDLFVTHLTDESHRLWKQGPRGHFRDSTAAAGLMGATCRSTGFGTLLSDFDHDGAPDLAVVNGPVMRDSNTPPAPEKSEFWRPYRERSQLFANDGSGRFRDISRRNAPLCGTPIAGRGLACGDIDNDGALDLLVTAIDGPARLYRNVAPNRGHWLSVRAFDPSLNRDAYGAEVTVRAGGRSWVRWLNPAYSYVCSNDPRAHFGLAAAGHVEAIEVRWPDGSRETFPGRTADQFVTLRKGEGKPQAR